MQWAGRAGAALEPLYEAHKRFVLEPAVLHVDEISVALLDPGVGKIRRAYVWLYARGEFETVPVVIHESCPGREAQYPLAFLGGSLEKPRRQRWRGTLVRDEYDGFDSVIAACEGPTSAGCLVHARSKFADLAHADTSAVAEEAIRRIAEVCRSKCEAQHGHAQQRLAHRRSASKPRSDSLHA